LCIFSEISIKETPAAMRFLCQITASVRKHAMQLSSSRTSRFTHKEMELVTGWSKRLHLSLQAQIPGSQNSLLTSTRGHSWCTWLQWCNSLGVSLESEAQVYC
jgi:hypothetical protein